MTQSPGDWGQQGQQGGYPHRRAVTRPSSLDPAAIHLSRPDPAEATRLDGLRDIRPSSNRAIHLRVTPRRARTAPQPPPGGYPPRQPPGGFGPQGSGGRRPSHAGRTRQKEPCDDHRHRRCSHRAAGSHRRHHHGADPRRHESAGSHHYSELARTPERAADGAADSGAHTDPITTPDRWQYRSRQWGRTHPGRRLAGQEERQECGSAVRRQERVPRAIAADLPVH